MIEIGNQIETCLSLSNNALHDYKLYELKIK
jgi:hypothetical protein